MATPNLWSGDPFSPAQINDLLQAKQTIMQNSTEKDVLVFVGNSASYFYYTFSENNRTCLLLPVSALSYIERGVVTPTEKQYDIFCKSVEMLLDFVKQDRKIIIIDHSGTGESIVGLQTVLQRCWPTYFLDLHFINLLDRLSIQQRDVVAKKLTKKNITIVCNVISGISGFFNDLFNEKFPRLVPHYPIYKWEQQVDNVVKNDQAAAIIQQLKGLQGVQGGGIGLHGSRHYTVVRASSGKTGGRYASNSGPAAAAKKAAAKRFGVRSTLRVTVRELGSSNSEFTYDATRVKLPKIAGVRTSEYRVDVNAVVNAAK